MVPPATKLNVPAEVELKTVNMAMELESLSYALVNDSRGRSVHSRSEAAARSRDG